MDTTTPILQMDGMALHKMGVLGRQKVENEFHERLVLKYYEDIIKTI